MTKDDWKKAVVTGIVTGVVGAFMIIILTICYIEISDWYREYKRNKADLTGVMTDCRRPGIKRGTEKEIQRKDPSVVSAEFD